MPARRVAPVPEPVDGGGRTGAIRRLRVESLFKLIRRIPWPEDEEAGQGMVEYAFIVVLVSLVALLLLIVVGHQTNNFYSNIQSAVSS